MRNSAREEDTKVVIKLPAKLRLNVGESDSLHGKVNEDLTTEEVEKWFQVEEDNEVVEALCQDLSELVVEGQD